MLKTIFEMYYIYKDADNLWYYKTSIDFKKRRKSKGYEKKKTCAIYAHISEAKILIKGLKKELNQIITFFNEVEYMEKNKLMSLDNKRKQHQLSLLYGACFNIIKEKQHKLNHVMEWLNEVQKIKGEMKQ